MEPSMGLLMDIRSGRRSSWGGSIAFWVIVGAGLGSAVVLLAPRVTESGQAFSILMGAGIGLGIGFYAAFGASRLARILEAPGLILDAVVGFVR